MDNYKVKVKKMHRATFSMIMVWLSDDEDGVHDQDNIKNQQLTLVWISYAEGLRRKIAYAEGDYKKLVKGLYANFHSDFADNITNLKQVANLEQVQSMLKIVESFIGDCVVSKSRS